MAPDGQTLTKGTWEYKPPLATTIPREFNVEFLKDSPFPFAVKSGKAVGEPPLVAAYSLHNATKNAISASRVERGLSPCYNLNIPATCDTVFAALEVSVADLAKSL
jgi:xanthine dehydrogenase/oxidase